MGRDFGVVVLTLDEGYLLTAALPGLQCGIAPLGPPAPTPVHHQLPEFTQTHIPHIQGPVAAWAQEGLEELSHEEGQEGRQ